jgi:hypothetical protein
MKKILIGLLALLAVLGLVTGAGATQTAYSGTAASQLCMLYAPYRAGWATSNYWFSMGANSTSIVQLGQQDNTAMIPTYATAVDVTITPFNVSTNTYMSFWPLNNAMPTGPPSTTDQITPTPSTDFMGTPMVIGVGLSGPNGPYAVAGIYNHAGTLNFVADVFGYFVPIGDSC